MKVFVILSSFLLLLDSQCNHKQKTGSNSVNDSVTVSTAEARKDSSSIVSSKVKGKVSHQFSANGCSTVIVSKTETGEELVLIPRTPLEKKFDKEGLEIFFNYKPLKIRQPPGCQGIPADISDVSLK